MSTYKEKQIFKKGSKTFFYSSFFFPKKVKAAVYTLYSFVRTADNFVDATPQQKIEFLLFKRNTLKAFKGSAVTDDVINRFVELCRKYEIPLDWVSDFLYAMESDLKNPKYKSYKKLESYMYGSAEVVGLMMAKILKLPKKSYPFAAAQGKAMQLINFVRDLKEDTFLGRQYLPLDDLKKVGLTSVSQENAHKHLVPFARLIELEVQKFLELQQFAEKGYKYIPKRYRVAIKTAADMYIYTAKVIRNNPQVIFQRKVKPSLSFIISSGIKNIFV